MRSFIFTESIHCFMMSAVLNSLQKTFFKINMTNLHYSFPYKSPNFCGTLNFVQNVLNFDIHT